VSQNIGLLTHALELDIGKTFVTQVPLQMFLVIFQCFMSWNFSNYH